MVCYPCQIGGKEYKGYTENPFPKGAKKREDIKRQLVVKNDYKNAYQNSGKELGEYIKYDSVSNSDVPEAYQNAFPFQEFLNRKIVKGTLLLMNFQMKCNKTVDGVKNPKRFYVAEFPFENVQSLRQKVSFTVQPTGLPLCGVTLGWGVKNKPCSIKVNYDGLTVDINSDVLKMKGIPYNAIWITESFKF